MTIKDQIIRERDGWRKLMPPTGGGPGILQEFILRNGQYYKGQELPSTFKRRPIKQCFYNAKAVVRLSRRLRYCEGYARNKEIGFLFHHAWAIDPEGQVVDPTLRDGGDFEYFGVWFDRKYVTGGKAASWEALLENRHGFINVGFMCEFDKGFAALLGLEEDDKRLCA